MKIKVSNLLVLALSILQISCGNADKTVDYSDGSWIIGPFERPVTDAIISPDPEPVFDCPMTGAPVKWMESDTFNPAAAVKDGKIVVLFRSEDNSATGIGKRTSRIGYAESTDGVNMTILPEPVMFPGGDEWTEIDCTGGDEDPRVAKTEDGLYVMLYTSWNRKVARLSVATSRDLMSWEKHGFVFQGALGGSLDNYFCKSGSIVTKLNDEGELVIEKINGKYLMYWGENFINPATSDDLIHWTPMTDENGELLKIVLPREGYFDSSLTECGPPAVHTKDGIVLIYNGKSKENKSYSAGQILFDANEPTKVLARLDEPFFKPELPFEKTGQYVDGTVFTEGLVHFNGCWYLYYGCADSLVGVAVCND